MEKKDQSYFNDKYFNNNGQSGDRPALKMHFKIFSRYLPSGDVLEYGAGEGHLTKRLATKYNSHAYDISEYCQTAIKKISPNTEVHQKEDFKENSVDGIITLHTLEHVPNPKETLGLFSKTMRKNGILYFVVPNVDGLGHKIKKERWFGYRDETHISMLKTEEWKRLVKEAGFKIIKTSSDGFWDPPYFKYIPTIIQKVLFLPTAGILLLLNRLIYPHWFGEDLIVVAEKE